MNVLSRFLLLILVTSPLLAQTPRLQLEQVVTGFFRPVDVAARSASEFLVAQTDGQIRLVKQDVIQTTPFLDLRAVVWDTGWDGIFGITLHPDYATNGYLYVHYARQNDHASVFARYTRSLTNPDLADPASAVIIFTVLYPNPGHRSGRIGFGPDGYLYITTGDSAAGVHGSLGDPDKLAQNLQAPYGKLFRIDVNHGDPYAIPPTNPFADPTDGVPDELYALGLRNPWRWSFDRQTGDFWLGDVGQDGWEELNFTAANLPVPQNYGWPCFEGTHAYQTDCSATNTYHTPLLDYAGYTTGSAASITGGFVYRGRAYPDLWGWYVYGDFSRGTYWTLKREPTGTYRNVVQSVAGATRPVSFGEGTDGELYVLSFNDGTLYHLISPGVASVQTGDWLNPATWSCACVPTNEDAVTVSTGHTISIARPVAVKSLTVAGKLMFLSGGKVSY